VIGIEDDFTSVKNWEGFMEGVDGDFVVFKEVGHFYQRDEDLEQLDGCLDVFLSKILHL
jgi:predicted alpha/beta hydrolase family esterase